MGNTEGKSATARDYHVTWSPALLPGGSPLDVGCHVTSTTTNSKAEGASRGGRLLCGEPTPYRRVTQNANPQIYVHCTVDFRHFRRALYVYIPGPKIIISVYIVYLLAMMIGQLR